MRWKKKKEPKDGDIRVVEKFLFFPLCINEQYRWLEKAKIRQKYIVGCDVEGWFFYWKNIEWVND